MTLHPHNPQSYGEITVMRADGSEITALTDNPWEDATPRWARSKGNESQSPGAALPSGVSPELRRIAGAEAVIGLNPAAKFRKRPSRLERAGGHFRPATPQSSQRFRHTYVQ